MRPRRSRFWQSQCQQSQSGHVSSNYNPCANPSFAVRGDDDGSKKSTHTRGCIVELCCCNRARYCTPIRSPNCFHGYIDGCCSGCSPALDVHVQGKCFATGLRIVQTSSPPILTETRLFLLSHSRLSMFSRVHDRWKGETDSCNCLILRSGGTLAGGKA